MIKNDIALAIEKNSGFNSAKSLLIVEAVLEVAQRRAGQGAKRSRFGASAVFKVVAKKTGYGRDIRRKKQIHITEGKRIKFRCGQELEEHSFG